MTTTMIEITSYNEKTQTATTFRPFAWFGWPMQIFNVIAATFKGVRISGGFVKRSVVNSPTGKITERATILETSILDPIVTRRKFNDPDDFRKASSL